MGCPSSYLHNNGYPKVKKYKLAAAISLSALIAGCGTTNNFLAAKTTYTEYFRVYDIKTNASPDVVGTAAGNGIGRDINDMQAAFPINTSGDVPSKPGYMKLVNPFQGSTMAAFLNSAGNVGFKVATCNGAAWTAKSSRNFNGSFGHSLTFCLFPYQGGYQLDMYGVLETETGGLLQIDRDIAEKAIGTPRQFMEKAFADTLEAIHAKLPKANITFVRGEPAPGPLPWIQGTVLTQ